MKQPSPGVPLWVPILVAVLGIVGIVAGQLINAWREDRRWRREQQREDLRWQRDQRKEHDNHSRELERQAHDDRLALYAEFLHDVQDLMGVIDAIRTKETDALDVSTESVITASSNGITVKFLRAQIVATEAVRHAIAEVLEQCMDGADHAIDVLNGREEAHEALQEAHGKIADRLAQFLTEARSEYTAHRTPD